MKEKGLIWAWLDKLRKTRSLEIDTQRGRKKEKLRERKSERGTQRGNYEKKTEQKRDG